MSIGLKENRVFPGELCLKYDGYWHTWNRMLHMDLQGSGIVEVGLTPINPGAKDSWFEQVYPIRVRVHRTQHGGTDRIFRHVMRNKHSLVFQEVKKIMLKHVPAGIVHRLLYDDLLGQIDWDRYMEAIALGYNGGGVPIALCERCEREDGNG